MSENISYAIMEDAVENLRRAILLITVLALITGAVVGFAMALNNKKQETENTSVNLTPEGSKYVPTGEKEPEPDWGIYDITNILFILGDREEKTADTVFAASVNFTQNTINMVFLPEDTLYSLSDAGKTKTGTLNDALRDGPEYVSQVVSGILTIPIDSCVFTDLDDFGSFVNAFTSRDDGVFFTMPVAVQAEDRKGETYRLQKGGDYYTGAKAKQLLRFYETKDGIYSKELIAFYDGTTVPKTVLASSFLREFLTTKLTGVIKSYYSDYYTLFVSDLLKASENSVPEDFPAKFAEAHEKFLPENVNCYLIHTEPAKNTEGRARTYFPYLEKVEYRNGKIETEELTEEKSKELLYSLY